MSMTVPLYGFGGGGGAALNFKVVGGLEQPANPKENTIWVKTEVDIPNWIFSATEPANPGEGMIWFGTGTDSTVEFNVLKKNGIQIYPLFAKQYASGAWVDVPAKSYQNSSWVNWVTRTVFIDDGKVVIKPVSLRSADASTRNGLWQLVAQGDAHFAANFACKGFAGRTIFVDVDDSFANGGSGYTGGIVLRTTPITDNAGIPTYIAQTLFKFRGETDLLKDVYKLKIPASFTTGYFAVHAETYGSTGYINIKNIWIE